MESEVSVPHLHQQLDTSYSEKADSSTFTHKRLLYAASLYSDSLMKGLIGNVGGPMKPVVRHFQNTYT